MTSWDMDDPSTWDYDRTTESWGHTFYGFDNDDGTTDWYDDHGGMDSTTYTSIFDDDD